MKISKYALLCAGILIACFWVSSCKKDMDSGSTPYGSAGKVMVRMTDAPADYDKVIVHVVDVQVNTRATDTSWVSLQGVRPGYYNLMDLSNGVDTLIAEGRLPSGIIHQIRLVLGTDNTIETNGKVYALQTTPLSQAGLILGLNTAISLTANTEILIDFDAAQSIVESAPGLFQLQPVLRSIDARVSGSITGRVQPGQKAMVTASQSVDGSVSYTDPTGRFKLSGLLVGKYTVTITPRSGSGYQQKVIAEVNVGAGQTTDLGSISM